MKSKKIKKIKKMRFFIVFIMTIMLTHGTYLIYDWYYIHQEFYKEADTLEEISRNGLGVGQHVSFYIDNYVEKAILSPEGIESNIYVEGNIEYEIYPMLIKRDTGSLKDEYIKVMVKDEETKRKIKNGDKVYFQGEIVSTPFISELDWYVAPDGELIWGMAIKQMEIPEDRGDLYVGIVLVILALVGIKICVPDVEIKPNKFAEYSFEYGTQTYNIRNDWMCEKDNLKNLQAEQIENKRVCNILIVVFIIGLILYSMAPMYLGKPIYLIPMFIGIGGVWSRFINSSNKLAVYIAKSRGKRSIYLEIEECKRNIAELERIMNEKNISE